MLQNRKLPVSHETAPASRPDVANEPLFRPEAMLAQQTQLHGTIRLMQPIAYTVWALGALSIVAAIAALLAFGEVTKRASVTGVLTPEAGIARLMATTSGVLTRVNVPEGAQVQEGAALFVINTERQGDAGGAQAAMAQQLNQRQALAQQDLRRADERFEARQRTVQERTAALQRELLQLEREVGLAAARVELAMRQQERTDALAQGGFVSESQRQAKQDELFIARQQQQGIERSRSALQKDGLALQSQLRDAQLQLDAERGDSTRTLALIAQEQTENEARRSTTIVAPKSGTVTAITAQPGQAVQAGTVLAQLLPTAGNEAGKTAPGGVSAASPLQAHFYAPTRSAGFIEPGQSVRLRYAAYPYQKFGQHIGTVIAVDKTPYAPREMPEQALAAIQASATSAVEASYRVTVSLEQQHISAYGKPQPLKPGMLVEADIIQRKGKLWEWITEPIKGFGQRAI